MSEAKLLERIEELEAEVANWRDAFGPSDDADFAAACRRVFGMEKRQIEIFSVLMRGREVSRDSLHFAVYGALIAPPDIKIVDVYVCRVRRMLRPHGIAVATVWGKGYHLTPESRDKVVALLELDEVTA